MPDHLDWCGWAECGDPSHAAYPNEKVCVECGGRYVGDSCAHCSIVAHGFATRVHRPDTWNLDSISTLCIECEGYWPCEGSIYEATAAENERLRARDAAAQTLIGLLRFRLGHYGDAAGGRDFRPYQEWKAIDLCVDRGVCTDEEEGK